METRDIKQTVSFKTDPHSIYEAIMDSRKHSKFSGSKASISRKVGGKITAYDGYIEGMNIELIPDQKIVQSWRGSDWQEGYYSEVTFKLLKIKTGTRLSFLHKGVPVEFYEDIKQGWIDFYWKPIRDLLES